MFSRAALACVLGVSLLLGVSHAARVQAPAPSGGEGLLAAWRQLRAGQAAAAADSLLDAVHALRPRSDETAVAEASVLAMDAWARLDRMGVAPPAQFAALAAGAEADIAAALRLLGGSSEVGILSGQRIQIDPVTADFGKVCVGETVQLPVTVTNKTNVPRTIDVRPNSAVDLDLGGAPPPTIPAGESATVTLHLTGEELGRINRPVFVMATDAGGQDGGIFLPVKAEVVQVLVTPDPVDFGEVVVRQKVTRVLTLRNCLNEQQTVTVTAITTDFITTPREVTLLPKGTAEVQVSFSALSAGVKEATLRVFGGRRGRRTVGSADLMGVAKEPISTDVPRIDFGTVPRNQFHNRSFAIRNETAAPQEVDIDTSRIDEEFFTVSPSGKVTLPPGGVRTVNLRFGATGRCVHRRPLMLRSPNLSRGFLKIPVWVTAR